MHFRLHFFGIRIIPDMSMIFCHLDYREVVSSSLKSSRFYFVSFKGTSTSVMRSFTPTLSYLLVFSQWTNHNPILCLPVSIAMLNSLHRSSSFCSQWCDFFWQRHLTVLGQLIVPALQALISSDHSSIHFSSCTTSTRRLHLHDILCFLITPTSFFVFISLAYISPSTSELFRFDMSKTFCFFCHLDVWDIALTAPSYRPWTAYNFSVVSTHNFPSLIISLQRRRWKSFFIFITNFRHFLFRHECDILHHLSFRFFSGWQ